MANQKMQIMGRVEYIDLVDIGLEGLPAKTDTGAYTSSIHCKRVKEVEDEEGRRLKVVIKLNGERKSRYFTDYKLVRVRSSNGVLQQRYLIKTRVRLGKKIYKTEFTLTDRSRMRYPILLGRKVMKGRFLVDVSKTFMLKPKQQPQ